MAPPPFDSSDGVLIYKGVQDLTGSYTIQTGSVVRPNNIYLKLKNEVGKELTIFANITTSFDRDYQVTGTGSWN